MAGCQSGTAVGYTPPPPPLPQRKDATQGQRCTSSRSYRSPGCQGVGLRSLQTLPPVLEQVTACGLRRHLGIHNLTAQLFLLNPQQTCPPAQWAPNWPRDPGAQAAGPFRGQATPMPSRTTLPTPPRGSAPTTQGGSHNTTGITSDTEAVGIQDLWVHTVKVF